MAHEEESVRDAFISGLRNPAIRQRLLESSDFTLDQACKTARSLDAAQKNAEQYGQSSVYTAAMSDKQETHFNQDQSENSIAYARPYNDQSKSNVCYFCGKGQHHQQQCPARSAICNICHRRGHFASACRSKPQSQQFDQNQHYKPPYVSRSSAAITSRPISYSPTLATTGGKSESKVYIPVLVNGITTTALVDTGSTESYVNKKFIEVHNIVSHPRDPISVKLSPTVQNLKWVLRDVHYLFLLPMKKGTCNYHNTSLSVTPCLIADVVLGEDFVMQQDSILIQYGGMKPQLTLCSLGTMRNITSPELFKYLKPECAPVLSSY